MSDSLGSRNMRGKHQQRFLMAPIAERHERTNQSPFMLQLFNITACPQFQTVL